MKVNFFKKIRTSYIASTLGTTILSNIMVFGQPILQLHSLVETKLPLENNVIKIIESPKLKEEKENKIFWAKQGEGKIGMFSSKDVENPSDNLFIVDIPENISIEKYTVKLHYDLYGLSEANQTTKSINNEVAYGGVLLEKNKVWKSVSEEIPPTSLKKGKNEIFFSRRRDLAYQYNIKKLRVELIPKNKDLIHLIDSLVSYNGKLSVSGYSANKNLSFLEINGRKATLVNGRFEILIDSVPSSQASLKIKYKTATGQLKQELFPISHTKSSSLIYFDEDGDHLESDDITVNESKENSFYAAKLSPGDYSKNRQFKLTVKGLYFKDIRPLNPDLVNVTEGKFLAYRLKRKINKKDSLSFKLHLKFDTGKIPNGYSPKDIRTLYYNRTQKKWKPLPIDSLDYKKKEIISTIYNENETDYINGIIKTPESPETGSFTPTMLSDMEYANPTSGVVGIAPPKPNNRGTLQTTFPLKIPKGRNGMQPSLQVSYNSEAGNGWMGIGWNITTPSVSLNTKWGVPQFIEGKESELYILNGNDLVIKEGNSYTNPHRQTSISRSPNRRFYKRIEGEYQKIIRHGDQIHNYWWEITDRYGNKQYYGGDPDQGVIENSVIRTEEGAIAHWALSKKEDPFGNTVNYTYHNAQSTISDGQSGQFQGQEFYPKKIEYTKHPSLNNFYEIEFKRNSYSIPSSSSVTRNDKIINARKGFIQFTDDLLTEIHVSYIENSVSQRIRSYKFEYQPVAFKKMQLNSIAEFDANDDLFYTNTLEYYGLTSGDENNLYGSETIYAGNNDNWITTDASVLLMSGIPSSMILQGSSLGTSKSTGISGGIRVGVGLGSNVFSKGKSAGGTISFSKSWQQGLISLFDVNGDGLPDKVFRDNNDVLYRENTGNGFSNTVYNLNGIDHFNTVESRTTSGGFDASFFGASIGKSWSKTRIRTENFFVDRNGDGLPDIVNGGRFLFNTASNGNFQERSFSSDIGTSENFIESGTLDPSLLDNITLPTKLELREENPQFDVVKIWEAPYEGVVDISSVAKMESVAPNEEQNIFRFTLEKATAESTGEANIIADASGSSQDVLSAAGTSKTLNYNNIYVDRGDMLLFRTHNKKNGSGGIASWNPTIEYDLSNSPVSLSSLNYTDENGKSNLVFNSKEDFLLTNGSMYEVTGASAVSVDMNTASLNWNANDFTDDIELHVKRIRVNSEGEEVNVYPNSWSMTYNHKTGNFGPSLNPSITLNTPTNYREAFYFYIESDSNIEWDNINWQPSITLTKTQQQQTYYETYYAPVDHKIYNYRLIPFSHRINNSEFPQPNIIENPETGLDDGDEPLIEVSHNLNGTTMDYDLLDDEDFPLEISLVLKEEVNGTIQVLDKRKYTINQYISGEYTLTSSASTPITISKNKINEMDNLFIGLYSKNNNVNSLLLNSTSPHLKLKLVPAEESQQSWSSIVLEHPFFTAKPNKFGNAYRGWGQFLYNGALKLERNDEGDVEFQNNGTPEIDTFFGESSNGAVKPIDMGVFETSNQNGGIEDIDEETSLENMENGDIGDFEMFPRYSLYTQDYEYIQGTPKNEKYISTGIGSTYGVVNNKLEEKLSRFGEDNILELYLDPNSLGDVPAGVFIGLKQFSISKGNTTSAGFSASSGYGGSANHSEAETNILNRYIDLNGDRYPDMVTDKRIQYTNALGALSLTHLTGQNFNIKNESEGWYAGATLGLLQNSTASDNKDEAAPPFPSYGVNLTSSASILNPNSSQGSTGLGGNISDSNNKVIWLDMNGDGLPDKVSINKGDNNDKVLVNLNRGYDFLSESIEWGEYPSTNTSKSETGGANASFSPDPYGSIGFGAGFKLSEASRKCLFIDVNGDGLSDLVYDNGGNNFKYKLNLGDSFSNNSYTFYNGSLGKNLSVSGNVYGTITGGVAFAIFGVGFKAVISPSGGTSAGFNQTNKTIQDIDGDGFPDLLEKDDNNTNLKVRKSGIGKNYLLKKVNTPLGGYWEATYERKGNTYTMPHNKWALSSIITNDGFDEDEINEFEFDETLTTMKYENPFYHRREREFLGFEKLIIEQREPSGPRYRYTERIFHNKNYYLKGAVKEINSYGEDEELISKTETLYNILDPENPIVNLNANESNNYLQASLLNQSEQLLDQSRLFIAIAKKISTSYEAGGSLSLVEEFSAYKDGNLTEYKNYGSEPEDAYKTEITYAPAGSFYSIENALGYPEEIKVTSLNSGEELRSRQATYNPKGKLASVFTLLEDEEINRTFFTYNNFGLLRKINELDNQNDAGENFEKRINYDSEVATYPIEVNNSFDHHSNTIYNVLFGIPVYTTDTNDQSMRTRIDDRGRVVEITGPNELAFENETGQKSWTIRTEYEKEYETQPTLENQLAGLNSEDYVVDAKGSFIAESPDAQHYAITRHNDPLISNNQFLTISIVDGLGEAIQQKKSHMTNNTMTWMVSGKKVKDEFGRVTKVYLPTNDSNSYPTSYTSTLSSNALSYDISSSPDNPSTFTTFKYDDRDRKTEIRKPGESEITSINYDIEGDRFTKTINNELQQTQKIFTDIRGRKRKTIQNEQIKTEFAYNAINELTSVLHNNNYRTNYLYDNAGRNIEIQHPDRGVVKMKYDNAGNLIEHQTSNLLENSSAIEYVYDFGRLEEINYPNNPENNVVYTYGEEGDPLAEEENAVGRILYQEDASGVQAFGYGRMGEITKNLRSIAVGGAHSYWFFTQWEYDSWNRVKEIVYPDQEKVHYHYNEAGNLKSISSEILTYSVPNNIINDVQYTPYGEQDFIEYGNGTTTTYTYDNRRRMETVSHQFSNFGIQNTYTYDEISNITAIATQNPQNSLVSQGQLGGPVTYNFKYDVYNRLEYSDGKYTGPNDLMNSQNPEYLRQEFELHMKYNDNHSIIQKTQTQRQGIVGDHGQTMSNADIVHKTSYQLDFEEYTTANLISSSYGYMQPGAPRLIKEEPTGVGCCNGENDPRKKEKSVEYDKNGNQTEIIEKVGEMEISLRNNVWDEENRLIGVDLNPEDETNHPVAVYTYDAGGQRAIKYNLDRIDVFSNSKKVGQNKGFNVMIYPSGLLTAKILQDTDPAKTIRYTKHYYNGSQRIASRLGTMKEELGLYPRDLLDNNSIMPELNENPIRGLSNQRVNGAGNIIQNLYSEFNIDIPIPSPIVEGYIRKFEHDPALLGTFYFHSDHLGSSNYISNKLGNVSQHMEYLPFGEMLVEEHTNSNNSPFKFNGKELDEETGNYYYGARYYDPKWSMWLSVDPLAEEIPSWSTYAYTFQNPINFTDPTGMMGEGTEDDYLLNENGTFTLLNKTETADRVFNKDGDFVELEYDGQIKDKKKYGNSSYLKISDESVSMEAFEFFAENSNVEWGEVITDEYSYLLTDESPFSVNTGGFAYSRLDKGENVKEINHSHPVHYIGGGLPSGYGHNTTKNNLTTQKDPYNNWGDWQSRNDLINGFYNDKTYYPGFGDKASSIISRVYNTKNQTYIQYGENRAHKIIRR
ncbi:SpvB/TcaC N-terminal domain-containing protein [Mesonia aquimarina]|uniref:SpvB/TcaC N-terminal domain-containing protein n=1 Tax=Mesonia aquimarina TaxID=1504967 RepID=UPI000EF5BE04|nr:SpvB/TcaC N-terminal domain-containing protein [Mesonia aquimarina]